MTEGYINHPASGKVIQQLEVVLNGQSVLNAQHDGFSSFCFVGEKILRCACNGDGFRVLGYNLFYLVKDKIGINSGSNCLLGVGP